jgi:hypothetical protein
MCDNQLFNVNGRLDRGGDKLLLQTLELAFALTGHKAIGWRVTKEDGLILDWYKCEGYTQKFPSALTAAKVFPMVLEWLASGEAKQTVLSKWCDDFDHDGDNGPGWQVSCGDWGHVGGSSGFISIKPACMWYGK